MRDLPKGERIKVGDRVSDGRKTWRVVRIVDIFGIPAADLIPVRKDGKDGVLRGRKAYANRPLSCLDPVG